MFLRYIVCILVLFFSCDLAKCRGWWYELNDPKIDALAQNIIQKDLEIKMAKIGEKYGKEMFEKSKASMLPKVSINGEYQTMSDSGNFLDMNKDQYGVDLVLSFDFNPGIDVVGAAKVELKISELEAIEIVNDRVASVLSKYFELCFMLAKREVLKEELIVLENDLEIANIGTKSGLFVDFEKTEILSEIDLKNVEILEDDIRISEIKFYLISILGYLPDLGNTVFNSVNSSFNFNLLLNNDFMKNRPDICCEYALIEKANIESKNISNNLPMFRFDAKAGFFAGFGNPINKDSFNTGISLSFRHKLFDGGVGVAESEASKSNEYLAKVRYKNTYNNVLLEIKNLLNKRKIFTSKYNLLFKKLNTTQNKIRILKEGFKNGIVEFETLRKLRVQLFRTKIDILKLRLELTLNIVNLLKGYSF